jgi:ABC-type lipoprotein release transport system permease subunit
MSFVVEPGTLLVGNQLVQALGLRKGDAVELAGEKMRVAACLVESGTDQDISVFGDLRDVQRITGLQGKINEIQALNCLCLDDARDSLEILREQLETTLPEARVIQIRPMADAREEQRRMIENYLAVALPFALVVAAAWVGLLAFINVRERWREIGILRALGHGSGKISALFLGRAVIIGLLGALVGFAVGTWLALAFGPGVFKVTANKIQPHFELLGWALVAAPVLSALAAFLPSLIAVTQDPAVSLRDE